MTDEERNYWVFFSAFPGIGPLRFKLLREYFGTAKKAWEASRSDLLKIGLGEKLTTRFINFRNKEGTSVYRYIEILKRKNIKVVTLFDRQYPKLLGEIPDAPFVLYVRGHLDKIIEVQPRIAVVGTRKITSYGREVTKTITQGLVEAGLVIVSGMAYGVDTMAHETAISCGGKTIAVLGCGIDIIYPRENSELYWQIVKEKGVVISEFPCGQTVARGLFPSRNRIISGLSLGVVVTEGAKDSGSLITARYAAEQGREVFAVPGPITSNYSKAPTILLKQGAKMVTEVEDILEELKISNPPAGGPITQLSLPAPVCAGRQAGNNPINEKFTNLTKEERKILEIMQNENLHFDEIVRKSGLEASKIGSFLTMMEMKGLITNLGGGVYGIKTIS